MKKTIFMLLVTLFYSISYSQKTQVPYRIGDKFGLANVDGKMTISAEYDILKPEDYFDYSYFVGYKILTNEVLSTLIYNNKIIFKDKKYNSYYINNGLIKAIEYKLLGNPSYLNRNDHTEIEHLYDLKGKPIFNGDFKSIAIIDDISETEKIDDILIYTTNMNDIESLYLYNKKLKKITKTLIENAKPINVNFNYSNDYRDRSITNIYLDKNGVGRKMIIELSGKTILIKSEEKIDFRTEKNRMESDYYDSPIVEMPGEKPVIPLNSEEEKRILTVRKVDLKRGFYYLSKKMEEIKIYTENLREDEQFIVSKNNKQGLYQVYSKSYSVPVNYDEIIFAYFEGRNGGHILRNGDKYGVFIYDHPKNKTIEPIFDKMPLLEDFNYFGDKKPLFKLYDNDGKLFCYADEFGKLFYKP